MMIVIWFMTLSGTDKLLIIDGIIEGRKYIARSFVYNCVELGNERQHILFQGDSNFIFTVRHFSHHQTLVRLRLCDN